MIFIIDDDIELGNSLKFFFKTEGMDSIFFSEGTEFINYLNEFYTCKEPETKMVNSVCLLDLRLAEASGLDLLEKIFNTYENLHFPVAMISGHGDIEIAVESMKTGAFDYVTKPIETEKLKVLINRGLELSEIIIKKIKTNKRIEILFSRLTDKETQIMELIANGNSNKMISNQLGNSIRTIELHRSRILQKLELNSAAELATLFERYQNVLQK